MRQKSFNIKKVKLLALALASTFFILSETTYSQSVSPTVYAPGDGTPNQLTFMIPVTASIGGVCGFATGSEPTGTYDAGAIDTTAWTHDFPFVMLCTVPSRVAVESSNGGLLAASATTTSGYTNLAPYTVTLNLQGSSTSVQGGCLADELSSAATAPCNLRGPASTTQGLLLNDTSINQTGSYLRVNAPAYDTAYPTGSALVAGAYADTLTVTISAAP